MLEVDAHSRIQLQTMIININVKYDDFVIININVYDYFFDMSKLEKIILTLDAKF